MTKKEITKQEWNHLKFTLVTETVTKYFMKKSSLSREQYLRIIDFVDTVIISAYNEYFQLTRDLTNSPISKESTLKLLRRIKKDQDYFKFLKEIIGED